MRIQSCQCILISPINHRRHEEKILNYTTTYIHIVCYALDPCVNYSPSSLSLAVSLSLREAFCAAVGRTQIGR